MAKITGKEGERFSGIARVYDCEEEMLAGRVDFVVDAIDNLTAKAHLIATCKARGIPLVSSMGAAGKMDPIDPVHLIFLLWGSTQHYADFSHQVAILNEHQPLSDVQFERAVQTVTSVILRGIGLEP